MKKSLVLPLMIILSCTNLFAPHQQEKNEPLFTRKECCILAAWMLAGASAKAYDMFYVPRQAMAEHNAPTAKKMN